MRRPVTSVLGTALCCAMLAAQSPDTKLFAELKWRAIGPYRGGRTRALAGVPGQPGVFYIGAVNGGVWKTNDFGRTWKPIFDHESSASIGAIAVAASDPNIVYVGSGEGLQRPDLSTGDGLYKSVDAGKTWTHLGLKDGQQIAHLAVDPHDPQRLLVAVMGHPYGPNEERGVFLSVDGGITLKKVLYKDENTGANDVEIDPSNPLICYAALWEARQGPWENGAWSGTGGGVFKSTDGGNTWSPLKTGLPDGVIQANLAIAPSSPNRIYAAVASQQQVGIYRSDDGGGNWQKITDDKRPAERIGGGDLPVPAVDPKNPDIVYSASIVTWKSGDGGHTWKGIRGAPGGDDYQSIWVSPDNGNVLLIVSDQGAIVTVNGGESWSSWYNQPTAQMYHANADNAFPYRVCGGQQESGSACIASRGNDGEITMREWHPVGVEEYGYAVPDPLDPDLVYGGKLTRYDRRTGQTANVGPKPVRAEGYRVLRTAPVVFSPIDPHILYFAANTLWKTRDGGLHWSQISPDLTRKTWEVPASVGKYRDTDSAKPTQRGVIYAVAPSPLDINRIWAGTDDGLIHLTSDGGLHWKDVTPPQLTPFAKVSVIDTGHFDKATAYAAINTFRLDDLRPHIYRTHDSGKTWTQIVNGIPDGAAMNAVREDPQRKGLLFAASERAVYISFDDGDNWQSLRLNMPATSVRDVIIKDDDLIAATHGRGFWILDDITALRQIQPDYAAHAAILFKPETTIRVRWNTNTDTPLPPDEPSARNPPPGAIVNYFLNDSTSGPVTLEVLDQAGHLVRRYSSDDPSEGPNLEKLEVPTYWARPPQKLSAEPGMHRFVWDLHYAPLHANDDDLPMQAVFEDTAPVNQSPWVMPGNYTLKLTVNGHTKRQLLTIKMDPRVKTTRAGLLDQFTLAKLIYDHLEQNNAAIQESRALDPRSSGAGRLAVNGTPTLSSTSRTLTSLLVGLQEADVAPTEAQKSAAASQLQILAKLLAQWNDLKKKTGANVQ